MARILILQDEPSWNAALRSCLESHHKLVVVSQSSTAIGLLQRERFDLVISRVHFHSEDVFQFLREINCDPVLKHIPVVCFCGLRSQHANSANEVLNSATRLFGAKAYVSIDDFCTGDSCNLEGMRRAIESAIDYAVTK